MHKLQKPCLTPKGFVSFLWDLCDHTFPPSAEAVFPRVREKASAQSKTWSWGKVGRTVGLTGLLFSLSHSSEWARLGQSTAFREAGTPFWPQKDLKSVKGAQLLVKGSQSAVTGPGAPAGSCVSLRCQAGGQAEAQAPARLTES